MKKKTAEHEVLRDLNTAFLDGVEECIFSLTLEELKTKEGVAWPRTQAA